MSNTNIVVIIAEKPSVANEIAKIVGASQKKQGYIEGNGYRITWAYGHLIAPAFPEDYGVLNYKADQLPIIPHPMKLVPRRIKILRGYKIDSNAERQLEIIRELFSACKEIIVATDAGREGELIFRYIYNFLNCKKPFRRLWISSLTEQAIRNGLQNLKSGRDYDNLYLAAEARSKADWLVGINASRALCITSGEGNNSLGRVQTPVLGLICKRYNENKSFIPKPYFKLLMKVGPLENMFQVTSIEEYHSRKEADSVYNRMKTFKKVNVTKVEVSDVITNPPLLYDLTNLQKDANIRYGLSAEVTLDTAQKLYEKKLITYPRTSSRYIPQDVFEMLPRLFQALMNYTTFAAPARQMTSVKLPERSVNDNKVIDHHALLITEEKPEKLNASEKIIYELIAGRMLECYSGSYVQEKNSIEIACGELIFSANGYQLKEKGWKGILNLKEEEPEKEIQELPSVKTGDILDIQSYNQIEKKTKPKPIYTEASLLSAMETAGNILEDKEKGQVLKGIGIGTPATRSGIIETLIRREYIMREKKNLIPTNKGMFIYKSVKDMCISNVLLTANWEETFSKIEDDPGLYKPFMNDIEEYTRKITDEILSIRLPEGAESLPSFPCPKCKKGMILFYHTAVRCKNPECGINIKKTILGVTLSQDQLVDLFKKKRTAVIQGFKKKKGRKFNAALIFDDDFNLKFDFSNDPKKSK